MYEAQVDGLYESLDSTSIRLLSIIPAFPSEPIECGLITVRNVEDAPAYDAISYVWGNEMSPEPVFVNGVRMQVTKNLADALRYLRPFPQWDSVLTWPPSHPLHSSHNAWANFATNRNEQRENASSLQAAFWIDAICINQQDIGERAKQVKLMRAIYQGALTVKIWLGKGDTRPLNLNEAPSKGSSKSSQVHLGQYGSMPIVLSFVAQALRNVSGSQNKLVSMKPLDDMRHRNVAYGFLDPSAKEWEVVRRFFLNPWFERVWVVQEVVLAKQATAILGDWQVQLPALGQAAVWFQAHGYALPRVLKYQLGDLKDFLPIANAAAIWEMHAVPGKKLPLLELLRDFRNRSATQDVDKVYATFGLAIETSKELNQARLHALIEPNYAKSVKQVYRDVARFLIVEQRSLLVLSHAGGPQAIKASQWPSWVPDWNHVKAAMELASETNRYAYNADCDQSLTVGDTTNGDILALQGIQADTIRVYGEKLKSYGFKHVTYQEEVDFVKAAWSLTHNLDDGAHAYSSKGFLQTFISTLTAGFPDSKELQEPDGTSLFEDAARWLSKYIGRQISVSTISKRSPWLPTLGKVQDSGLFHETFVRTCMDRRFFVSGNQEIGIGPETIREGDVIVILFGGKVPYVLRRAGTRWKFIGECYIPGLMSGEAVERWKADGQERAIFEII